MKPTVTIAVSDKPIAKDDLVDWANREALPFFKQARAGLNAAGIERASGRTAGAGAYVTIWTSPEMPTDATWNILASVAAMTVPGAGTERAGYLLAGAFESVAGTVTLFGSTSLYSHETTAAIDARFAVSGRTAIIEVRDDAIGAMDFVAVIYTTEVRTS
jgi:hypothetical protein